MSTYIGNQVNSIQVTESAIQLNCDSNAAISLQIGTQNIDMHNKSLINMSGFASEVSMNSYKITNLGVATSNGDALSRQTGDGRYYQNTVTLDSITAPTASLDLNSQTISNLANATADTDALNRQTADSRYYQSTVPINNITAATGSLSLNSQKIINLADPTNAQEAATKNYTDTSFYANTTPLNNITLATSDIDANNQYIVNVANPIAGSDAATKSYIDSNFYLNTVTLDSITAPTGSLSMNNRRIINLAAPQGNDDATSKTYVDSNFYTNTTALNSIQGPSGDVSLNSFKITNLAAATIGSDALNRETADNRYYQKTVTLDQIELATSHVNMNAVRIENLGDPVNAQDATTKSYVDTQVASALDQTEADARYYLNTVTLDAIELPVLDVDFNSQKIVNLLDPVSNQDGATKSYVDTQIANLVDSAPGVLDTLNELAAALGNDPNFATTITNLINEKVAKAGDTMTGNLNMDSNMIHNLSAPVDNTDAANKHYVDTQVATALDQTEADALYYLNTTTLNNITAPTASVDMNFHNLINVTDPTNAQDAATKHYVDNNFYADTATLNQITAPDGDLTMNTYKITNLVDPVNAQDAATKSYVDAQVATSLDQTAADARYYLNTTTLDSIVAPTANVSLNNNRITDLANPAAPTDALNKQTADSSYYGQAVSLNNITAPTGNVSMNSFKITELAPATTRFDAMTLSQDLRWHWVYVDFLADVTSGFSNPMVIQFDHVQYATLTDVSQLLFWDTDGITLFADHYYLVQVQLELEYVSGVNLPVIAQIRLADDTTVYKQFTTNRAPALNTPQLTTYSFVMNTTQQETIKLWLTTTTNLSKILKNSHFRVQMLA